MTPAQQWALPRNCEISTARLDEQHVVYHSGTGRTHLLDAEAAAVLELFITRVQASLDDILRQLPNHQQSEADSYYAAILRSLQSAALIEAVK